MLEKSAGTAWDPSDGKENSKADFNWAGHGY